MEEKKREVCPYAKSCGSCQYQGIPYEEQLAKKQKYMKKLLGDFGKIQPVIGMQEPYYYRNKVHHVFDHDRSGNVLCGFYKNGTHHVVSIDSCMIEDQKSQEIIQTILKLMKSFKIRTYDEDTGKGLFRHILIRRGFSTGEIMVVVVIGTTIFPSKKNFVNALLAQHPEITTLVINQNPKKTTFVLGEKQETVYGPGYIKDILCGLTFRISPKSFYQINPVQTEILYKTAIQFADLNEQEVVLDAYCGTGTIGLTAAGYVKNVIGVELNKDAVRDAVKNAKNNAIANARFYTDDAGRFMVRMAQAGEHVDVVFMDPPRSGSDEKFLSSLVKLAPKKVVYVSCGPETLRRDLMYLKKHDYQVRKIQPVDLFPYTAHIENVVLLQKI